MKNTQLLQIGVVGSMHDSKIQKGNLDLAKKLGKEIAQSKQLLMFGHEGDCDSISQMAARSCEENGGKTVAFLWGTNKQTGPFQAIRISTGMARGGAREAVFINSCDVIIAIGGGSGTLTEMCIAYQSGIPIIAIQNTGGWSNQLANKFMDSRKRMKILSATDAREAVKMALRLKSKSHPSPQAQALSAPPC